MTLGVRAPGRHWKHRWALTVLNTAIGGGLSSRLFQQIREERGLAYTVYSTVDMFADTGALSVYAACLPERFGDVVDVTTDVLRPSPAMASPPTNAGSPRVRCAAVWFWGWRIQRRG